MFEEGFDGLAEVLHPPLLMLGERRDKSTDAFSQIGDELLCIPGGKGGVGREEMLWQRTIEMRQHGVSQVADQLNVSIVLALHFFNCLGGSAWIQPRLDFPAHLDGFGVAFAVIEEVNLVVEPAQFFGEGSGDLGRERLDRLLQFQPRGAVAAAETFSTGFRGAEADALQFAGGRGREEFLVLHPAFDDAHGGEVVAELGEGAHGGGVPLWDEWRRLRRQCVRDFVNAGRS
jgi:hypothetical protein